MYALLLEGSSKRAPPLDLEAFCLASIPSLFKMRIFLSEHPRSLPNPYHLRLPSFPEPIATHPLACSRPQERDQI